MGVKKGMINNPAGRPKGATNKVSVELRETITYFLEDNFDEVKKLFKSKRLHPKDKLKFYTDLLPYVVPKLQSSTMDISFDTMTDEQLDAIMDRLIKSTENE